MEGELENRDNDTGPDEVVENYDKVERKRSQCDPENYGRWGQEGDEGWSVVDGHVYLGWQ